MRSVLTHGAAILLTVACAALLWYRSSSLGAYRAGLHDLGQARSAVQNTLGLRSSALRRQLAEFCTVVARDQNFAMKLLVENDRSASEVTELAPRFMGPMGLSVLEITDSALVVVSSGHFPMNVGNTISQKADIPLDRPVLFEDNIRGKRQLTWQARAEFSVEGVRFYCFGGWFADSLLLAALAPGGVELVLRCGERATATVAVESLSPVKDHSMAVNNVSYLADSLSVSSCLDSAGACALLVLVGPRGRGLPSAGR